MEDREQITERTERARRQANAQARSYWLAVVMYLTICLLPAPAFSLGTGIGLPTPPVMSVADGEYIPPSVDLPVALAARAAPRNDIPQTSPCMFQPYSAACELLRWRLQEARGPPLVI